MTNELLLANLAARTESRHFVGIPPYLDGGGSDFEDIYQRAAIMDQNGARVQIGDCGRESGSGSFSISIGYFESSDLTTAWQKIVVRFSSPVP